MGGGVDSDTHSISVSVAEDLAVRKPRYLRVRFRELARANQATSKAINPNSRCNSGPPIIGLQSQSPAKSADNKTVNHPRD
jgi:hypothetical protein